MDLHHHHHQLCIHIILSILQEVTQDSRFDIGLAKGVLHLLWLLDSVFVVLSEDKSVSLRTWPAYKHCLLGNTTAPSSTTTTHCSFLPPSPVVVVVVGRKKFHSPIRCILLTGFTLLYSLSAAPAFIPMILSVHNANMGTYISSP